MKMILIEYKKNISSFIIPYRGVNENYFTFEIGVVYKIGYILQCLRLCVLGHHWL